MPGKIPSQGLFSQSSIQSRSFLKKLGLADEFKIEPVADTDLIQRARRAKTYREEYDVYSQASCFDARFDDGALLLFRRTTEDKTVLSYLYLPSPYDALRYGEFVREVLSADPDPSREHWDLYQEYLGTVGIRSHVVPIRYDWSPSLYRTGAHPAGHLHVGYRTHVRIAVDYILTPILFTHLVTRQFYPVVWEEGFIKKDMSRAAVVALRSNEVSVEYRTGADDWELRLR